MGVYWEIVKKQFKLRFVYRSNFYLSILGNLFYYFLMISIWSMLYRGKDTINGISLKQMVCYVIISAFLGAISRSGIAFTIAGQVRDGSIGNELIKPVSYKYLNIAQELGSNLFYPVFVMLPAAALMGIIYGFSLTDNLPVFILFTVSAVMGAIIMYSLSFIFGMLAFWFKTAEYVTFFTDACMTLFSGSFIPLWFYPNWLYNISMALPFRFVTFEPLSIYLGRSSINQALLTIAYQIIWFLVLFVIEKLMWRSIQKYLVIQGG